MIGYVVPWMRSGFSNIGTVGTFCPAALVGDPAHPAAVPPVGTEPSLAGELTLGRGGCRM